MRVDYCMMGYVVSGHNTSILKRTTLSQRLALSAQIYMKTKAQYDLIIAANKVNNLVKIRMKTNKKASRKIQHK